MINGDLAPLWPQRQSLRSRRRLIFLERQAKAAPGRRIPKVGFSRRHSDLPGDRCQVVINGDLERTAKAGASRFT